MELMARVQVEPRVGIVMVPVGATDTPGSTGERIRHAARMLSSAAVM